MRNFSSNNFIDMNCMAFSTQFSNSVIIGGYQQSLVALDLNRIEETKNVNKLAKREPFFGCFTFWFRCFFENIIAPFCESTINLYLAETQVAG